MGKHFFGNPVKTKAYKLAAELGLKEQPVLEWLRVNGYPNVRRADMIRSDVAQAARKALSATGRDPRSNIRVARSRGVPRSDVGRRPEPQRPDVARRSDARHSDTGRRAEPISQKPANQSSESLSVSFAELLQGHLPSESEAGSLWAPTTGDTAEFNVLDGKTVTGMPAHLINPDTSDLDRELGKLATDRHQEELKVERAKVAGLERMLSQLQEKLSGHDGLVSELERVTQEVERAQNARLQMKHQLDIAQDQQQTLEATCCELQDELKDVRGMLNENESLVVEHDSVLGDLQTAREREVAWRTRALELERAAHAGDDLSAILSARGLSTEQEQIRALQSTLANEEIAHTFLKAVRQVDPSVVTQILTEKLRPTCTHQICRKVTQQLGKYSLRVDDDRLCECCKGESDRRWFSHLAAEGARAGIRRFLVVGGRAETQERLRVLSEGLPIDLRLIVIDEDSNTGRIDSRVEGCDALVLWHESVTDSTVNELYAKAAHEYQRLVVQVLAQEDGVIPFARAAAYRVARTHLFQCS